jgi:hypothetical protein
LAEASRLEVGDKDHAGLWGRFRAGFQTEVTPIETQRTVWPKAERVRENANRQKRQVAIDRIQRLMLQHGLKAKDLGQLFQ